VATKHGHSSLVCVVEISYQLKKLHVIKKNFSERFNIKCVLKFFLLFFDIPKSFSIHNESIE